MAQDPNQTQPWNPTTGINSYPTVAAVPEQATTSPAAAAAAEASTATAATRAVDDNELMSTQVNKIIAQDSPLMQQAGTEAKKQANARGLLNSSMAVQAGQEAVMNKAMPIAQYDAGVNTNVLDKNLSNTQQTNVFNAGQTQDVSKFNANNQQQNNQFNAGEANKMAIVNASESNDILAQMMDQQSKLQLADIEASYKTLMQAEASAMTLYQQSVKNISEILMNPDLTAAAKTAAVNNQNSLLKTGMEIVGKMSGLNLDELLTFPTA
jgi:hypothetical protein